MLGIAAGDQQAGGAVRPATDPPAQLVQLGDAEAIGVHDHHERGIGDVDADLDHGGADQQIDLPGGEGLHGLGLLRGVQAPVQHRDPRLLQLGRPLHEQLEPGGRDHGLGGLLIGGRAGQENGGTSSSAPILGATM